MNSESIECRPRPGARRHVEAGKGRTLERVRQWFPMRGLGGGDFLNRWRPLHLVRMLLLLWGSGVDWAVTRLFGSRLGEGPFLKLDRIAKAIPMARGLPIGSCAESPSALDIQCIAVVREPEAVENYNWRGRNWPYLRCMNISRVPRRQRWRCVSPQYTILFMVKHSMRKVTKLGENRHSANYMPRRVICGAKEVGLDRNGVSSSQRASSQVGKNVVEERMQPLRKVRCTSAHRGQPSLAHHDMHIQVA